jgi:hypothetical protein
MSRQGLHHSAWNSSISVRPGPPDMTASAKTTGNEIIGFPPRLADRHGFRKIRRLERSAAKSVSWFDGRRGVKVSYFPQNLPSAQSQLDGFLSLDLA